MKRLFLYLLLLAALVAVVPCAGAQTVTLPLPTPVDPVGTATGAVGTATGAVNDLTQPVPVPQVGSGVGGTVSTAGQTVQQTATGVLQTGAAVGGSAVPSTSSSGSTGGTTSDGTTSGGSRSGAGERDGRKTSPGKEFRSRFDRLPPRLERLLERIELGRNVRANLARLRQALASLSAAERARVLRLLNAEIRRLRAGGVSPAERRRIARLLRAREVITAAGAQAPAPAGAAPTVAGASSRLATDDGNPLVGEVLAMSRAGRETPRSPETTRTPTGGSDSAKPSGIINADDLPFDILLGLGALLLVVLAGLVVREEWPGLRGLR